MTTTPQTKPYGYLGDYEAVGELLVRVHLVGDGVAMFSGRGAPNGVVPGVDGQLYLDLDTGAVWQNTDAAKAWTLFIQGGGEAQQFAFTNVPATPAVQQLVVLDATRVAGFNVGGGIAANTRLNLPDTATTGALAIVSVQGALAHDLTVSCDANDTRPGALMLKAGQAWGSVAFVYNGDNNWQVIGQPVGFTFVDVFAAPFGLTVLSDGTNWAVAGASVNVDVADIGITNLSVGAGTGFALDLSAFKLPAGMTKWSATWASIGPDVQNIGTPFIVPGASTLEARFFTGGGIVGAGRGGALWIFPVSA